MADRDPEIYLGRFTERAERLMNGETLRSVEDVLHAAFDALDREESGFDSRFRHAVREAVASPGRRWTFEEAKAELEEHMRRKV